MNPTVRAVDLGYAAGVAGGARIAAAVGDAHVRGRRRRRGPRWWAGSVAAQPVRVLSATAAQVPDELVRTYVGARLKRVAIALSTPPPWFGQ
ncbi:hypothetical protein AIIKEEIJ_03884 [Rhodococcus sp. YH1]|nr:hypothetical protein [Rhodococcus sp. YH1]